MTKRLPSPTSTGNESFMFGTTPAADWVSSVEVQVVASTGAAACWQRGPCVPLRAQRTQQWVGCHVAAKPQPGLAQVRGGLCIAAPLNAACGVGVPVAAVAMHTSLGTG